MPKRPERILILAGTAEARKLAEMLLAGGFDVISSLAGVTQNPVLPPGEVRQGGFGGSAGLVDFIRRGKIDFIVDASHPFAAQISRNAGEATLAAGIPCWRLERPAWQPGKSDLWHPVPDIAAAVETIASRATALVTIGRKEIARFAARSDIHVIARMIEASADDLPPAWHIIQARPPFSIAQEVDLMQTHHVDVLVTKNAGGTGDQKLSAARQLQLPVIMITRPPKPLVPTFETPKELLAGLLSRQQDKKTS